MGSEPPVPQIPPPGQPDPPKKIPTYDPQAPAGDDGPAEQEEEGESA